MKRILITGANSYIGSSFEEWLKKYLDDYSVDTLGTKDEEWRKKDFSGYDAVFHVAGIAHVDVKKATEETKALYYKINRDLTIEIAKKAKEEGVIQFIFMSSIIVYGDSAPIGQKKVITKETIPIPSNFYGDSKLQAEKGILPMQSEDFNVVVLRPPMIYGKGSKGNYQKLAKLAKVCPIFPDVNNERSMLHIDNLCEFVRLMIDNKEKGLFFPQNEEYVKTSGMVELIAEVHGKKIKMTRIFNPVLRVISSKIKFINKVFGNLVYDKIISEYKSHYFMRTIEESIKETER